ncbi:MAG: winged helix-turn-helix transcriptional regulator [Anaerolineales bacterium]|nr:winged helix-turn-helix transcriptional regulator [Anaerolineales bacterium]
MDDKKWAFMTNHAAVLIILDGGEHLTAREISLKLDITIRTVYRIIRDLEQAGYINKQKEGRENRYTINKSLPLRRNDQRGIHVHDFLQLNSNKK